MTDPLDDLIRDQLRDSFPQANRSSLVLEELRPRMVRARSRRRTIQASAAIGTLGAVLIGALLVLPQLGGTPSELDVAGPEGSGSVIDSDSPKSLESPATSDALGRTIEEPSERDSDETPTSPTVAEASATSVEPSTTAPTSETTATTSAPTTESTQTTTTGTTETTTTDTTTSTETTTTAAPTTTQATTTTTQPSGLIETVCGSLTVELIGSGIGLVSTDPDPGFTVEVKKSGPAEVEVSFEGEGLPQCEVTAENRNGQIWFDLHDEDE